MFLTNEQWSLIEPMIAPHIPARSGLGRPPIDERWVLDGIFWKISHNAAWYDLPPEYPSYQTCFRRYRLWIRLGVLSVILGVLQKDLCERGGLDFARAYQEGRIIIKKGLGEWRCAFEPQYSGTWQQSTAMIFLGIALKKLKQRRTLRIE